MVIMTFVILIAMFFLGINTKNRGVVNYKFTLEIVVLTLLIMPAIATAAKGHLSPLMPELLAAIIGILAGLIIVFLVMTFILGKIAKIPEYEYTSSDKMLGFFTGMLKGYCVMAFLILFYGITFIDRVAPEILTINFKQNFINRSIGNSVEYYRTSVYRVYIKTSGAGVEDLYKKGPQVIDYSKYVNWSGDEVMPNETVDRKSQRRDKPGKPLPDIN